MSILTGDLLHADNDVVLELATFPQPPFPSCCNCQRLERSPKLGSNSSKTHQSSPNGNLRGLVPYQNTASRLKDKKNNPVSNVRLVIGHIIEDNEPKFSELLKYDAYRFAIGHGPCEKGPAAAQ